jgi:hypothetical protein
MLLINEREFLILFNQADMAFYSGREAFSRGDLTSALNQFNILFNILKELKERCSVTIYPP